MSLRLEKELKKINFEGHNFELCLDHHAVSSKEFVSKFDDSLIELSGSCFTILFKYFKDPKTLEIFEKYFSPLLAIGAFVMQFDSFGWNEAAKNNRWLKYEKPMAAEIMKKVNYTTSDEDYKGIMDVKFSKKQFDLSFRQLMYTDAKTFEYGEDLKKVEYGIFSHDIETYFENLGEKNIFEETRKLIEEK